MLYKREDGRGAVMCNYLDDVCYECTGYGDNYYFDEDGEMVSACTDCWVMIMDEVENG